MNILAKRIMKILLLQSFLLVALGASAQELDAEVQVSSQKIKGVDNSVFVSMERSLQDLLSATSWTDKEVPKDARIPCSFVIVLDRVEKDNTYRGTLQVQASRPVFESVYTTTLINHRDKDFVFTFFPNKTLQYNKGGKTEDNLVAVLAFYANLIIGLEADSFSKFGGNPYIKEARNIVSRQNGEGWDGSEQEKNRYWIIEDYKSSKFLRESQYIYHRKGLDLMVDDPRKAIENIEESLLNLEKSWNKSTQRVALHMFFDAKAKEIADSMKALPLDKRKKLLAILEKIDPGHISIYKVLEK